MNIITSGGDNNNNKTKNNKSNLTREKKDRLHKLPMIDRAFHHVDQSI